MSLALPATGKSVLARRPSSQRWGSGDFRLPLISYRISDSLSRIFGLIFDRGCDFVFFWPVYHSNHIFHRSFRSECIDTVAPNA
jgi:hypothetical protein